MLSRVALRAPARGLLVRQLSTASPRTVVALGGNALVRPGEEGTPAQQASRAREAAKHLAAFPRDTELVVTHGNGPQVGEILLRSDLTADKFPAIPIDLAVSATQGQIGVMLQHSLAEAREIFRNAAAVVAPHGGALLNMVFMRPGAVVVEIGYYERNAYQYNSMRFPPWYFVFAKHMRLNHWLVMAPGSYGGPIECPVDLTLDTLRAALP